MGCPDLHREAMFSIPPPHEGGMVRSLNKKKIVKKLHDISRAIQKSNVSQSLPLKCWE